MQRFKQGDRVCVIGPIAENYPGAVGIVRAVMLGGNVYRCVVQFEDGTLDTFFGLQLRLAWHRHKKKPLLDARASQAAFYIPEKEPFQTR